MSMKMVCDRCGHVKDKVDIFAHITYKTMTTSNNIDYEEYDICSVCAEQFERFMNGCEVEEEDLYKDSKPCDVIIHKLGNGNYAIENDLRVAKEFAEAGKIENLEEEIVRLPDGSGVMVGELPDMDKEESDLSVPISKSSSGVYMPEGKPWSTRTVYPS